MVNIMTRLRTKSDILIEQRIGHKAEINGLLNGRKKSQANEWEEERVQKHDSKKNYSWDLCYIKSGYILSIIR